MVANMSATLDQMERDAKETAEMFQTVRNLLDDMNRLPREDHEKQEELIVTRRQGIHGLMAEDATADTAIMTDAAAGSNLQKDPAVDGLLKENDIATEDNALPLSPKAKHPRETMS
jgi:hypothetical protein